MLDDGQAPIAQQQEFAAKYTSAQTHAVVVADPAAASARYVIDYLYVGGDANGTLQIEDSANAAIAGYFFVFGANFPTIVDQQFLKKITLGKGFRITTTGGGNHAVLLKYHLEAQGAP